jgi:hypothetical protein
MPGFTAQVTNSGVLFFFLPLAALKNQTNGTSKYWQWMWQSDSCQFICSFHWLQINKLWVLVVKKTKLHDLCNQSNIKSESNTGSCRRKKLPYSITISLCAKNTSIICQKEQFCVSVIPCIITHTHTLLFCRWWGRFRRTSQNRQAVMLFSKVPVQLL